MVTGANLAWGITGDKRLGPGDEFSAPFDKAGVYPYTCLLHPGMTGAIVVAPGTASTGAGAGTVADAPTAPLSNVTGAPQAAATEGPGPLLVAAAVGAVVLALLGSIAWLGRRRGGVARTEPH